MADHEQTNQAIKQRISNRNISDNHTHGQQMSDTLSELELLRSACGENGAMVLALSPTGLIERSHGASLLGFEDKALQGQTLVDWLPAPIALELQTALHEVLQTGNALRNAELYLVLSEHEAELLYSLTPRYKPGGQCNGAFLVLRDVSEVLRMARELQELQSSSRQRTLVLETASRVALGILSSRTGIEALRHIADAARILSGARYGALGVARLDGEGLEEFVTVGLTPEEHATIGELPKGRGVLGVLLTRHEPLRLNNIAAHPDSAGFPANHPIMRSFLGVPIRRGDEVMGSLYLTDKQGGGPFTEADETAVQALGAHAAVAIHNLHLLKRQRALTNSLITAQEEERRAVAYDLHDGLTQFVMAAHAHLEAFQRAQFSQNFQKASNELEMGLKYLKESVIESRRLVNGLRSLALDDLGLVGAIELLVAEEKSRAGWEKAEFIHNLEKQRFDWTLETGAYRVAQEALTNVRKHAKSPRLQIKLHEENRRLHLEVRDWGSGFSPQEQKDTGRVGLQGMAERVSSLSGSFVIKSQPGQGTIVRATFPISEPKNEDLDAESETAESETA